MLKSDGAILSNQQVADYDELGFVHSIPILSQDEVEYYRAELEVTCSAIGGRVTRLNMLHLYFRWAWELSTHPRLLDCLEQLLGPNILLKTTRIIYKYGKSASYVGWHQDGITERLEDGRAPAIWLGLTDATVENGCLRVVPLSHQLGLLPHDSSPDLEPLPGTRQSAQVVSWSKVHGDELSGRITNVPTGYEGQFDIVMRPGEMSIHHPVILHGSNPNLSNEPRIGLSASYSTPELYDGRKAVVWARGNGQREYHHSEFVDSPPMESFEEALTAYCANDGHILIATV